MEDRPLARRKIDAPVRLKVEALGDHNELVPRHPKIADEFVTKLRRSGDHVVAALGAIAPNGPPHRSESASPRLKVVDNLDDGAPKRKGHCLTVDHKVRIETIDGPFRTKPRYCRGKPRQRLATQGKERQIETRG